MAQFGVDLVVRAVGGNAVKDVTTKLKGVDTAARKAQNGIVGFTTSTRAAGTAAKGAAVGINTASTATKGLGATLAATLAPLVGLTAALGAAGKAISVAFERDSAEQKLRNFTSSTEEYNIALALAAQTSQKFGISQTEALTSLADMNSRLRGLGFGLKEVSKIQQGFQAIVAESGTSAEDASGAFLQLSQALGSGVLQGDELRSVLERMPTLAQAIAENMGVSADQIRQLGAEGAITSQIIQATLANAAASSEGLTSKLSATQQSMKMFGVATDAAFVAVGQALGPAIVAAVDGITWATRELTDWWGYLATNVFPQVQAAILPVQEAFANAFSDFELRSVVELMQNGLLIAIDFAVIALGKMSEILAGVINGFKALSGNPVFQFIAEQVGNLVNQLGLADDKVGQFKSTQEGLTEEIAAGVEEYSKLPTAVAQAAAGQERMLGSIKGQTQLLAVQQSQISNSAKLADAQLAAETAINQKLQQQAKTRLAGAKNAEQQVQAAEDLFALEVIQAESELQATLAQIEREVEKARVVAKMAVLREKELEILILIAKQQNEDTSRLEEALFIQRQVVKLAEENYKTVKEVAKQQKAAAHAVYEAKVEAAELALAHNKIWQGAKAAADESGRYAANMAKGAAAATAAADATTKLAAATGNAANKAGAGMEVSGAAYETAKAMNKSGTWNELSNLAMQNQKTLEQAEMNLERVNLQMETDKKAMEYAAAGFGEAAQLMREYSATFKYESGKLAGQALARRQEAPSLSTAMNEYGRTGGNTSISPQVNIQTGPVTQIAGTNYVTQQDLQNTASTAAKQGAQLALDQLKNNPDARRYAGVGR